MFNYVQLIIKDKDIHISSILLLFCYTKVFIFQPILMDFFIMFLMKLTLYDMLTDLLMLLLLQRYKGEK